MLFLSDSELRFDAWSKLASRTLGFGGRAVILDKFGADSGMGENTSVAAETTVLLR
jgi:hypothetical protein